MSSQDESDWGSLFGGLPKLVVSQNWGGGGTFLGGVPTIRIVVFWGLYGGSPI